MFKINRLMVLVLCLSALTAYAGDFSLSSPAVKPGASMDQEQVYNGYGCQGQNRSPALEWTAGPEGTRSYAVTVFDPDAPNGSGWWHWVVYNIPADVNALPAGAGDERGKLLPPGAVQGRTDFGSPGYGGPCPPKGHQPHHYIFTVYALKTPRINIPPQANPRAINSAIKVNALGSASFTALYGR